MEENNFNITLKKLCDALIDDFRGFLVDGHQLIEVPENLLHLHIAFQEMSKVPGWKYESGIGQNPTIEYMKEKKAIYITRIPAPNKPGEYQRTVGYLTDAFPEEIQYKEVFKPQYEIIKQIALGMGYDVDEYTLQPRKENSVKTPVSITTYKSTNNVRKSKSIKLIPSRNLSEGDKPVFGNDNKLLGFISNGKFVSKSNFRRYSTPKKDSAFEK